METMAWKTAEEALVIARGVAHDRATVAIHVGERNHRAIRVTGCTADEGRAVVMDVARALWPDEDHDDYGFQRRIVEQAGFVAVWLA